MAQDKITVSFSELDCYRQCPHKHELSYKERWTRRTESPSLRKGSLFHKVMEGHYRSLMERPGDLISARKEAYRWLTEWSADWGGEDGETADLIWWMYEGYVEMWGADDDWEIVGVEQKFEVPLLTAQGRPSRFNLKLQIDLIVKVRSQKNRLWIVDHKSGANLPGKKTLDMADQFGFYLWAMRQLGYPAFAGIWNAARTTRLKTKESPLADRFARMPLTRTDFELNTIATEAYASARNAYRSGALAPRHPDADTCSWKCGFLDACLFGRKVGNDREREFLVDSGWVRDDTRH